MNRSRFVPVIALNDYIYGHCSESRRYILGKKKKEQNVNICGTKKGPTRRPTLDLLVEYFVAVHMPVADGSREPTKPEPMHSPVAGAIVHVDFPPTATGRLHFRHVHLNLMLGTGKDCAALHRPRSRSAPNTRRLALRSE